MINNFISICKKTQKELKRHLAIWLKRNGYNPILKDGFIYAKGQEPIGVTAHLDTVHVETPKQIIVEKQKGMTIISSPQGIGGDDRCGVYMIQRLVELGYKPTIIFCEDEETGGKGSKKLCKAKEIIKELESLKLLIELDRAHASDLVFYDDANWDFHEWCEDTTGYKADYGSFSDISNLCPEIGISGVNISCGYYNAHTKEEYVVWEEMEESIRTTELLIKNSKNVEQFEYKEYVAKWGTQRTNYLIYERMFNIYFIGEDGEDAYECYDAVSYEEVLGKWMINHPTLSYRDIYEVGI